MKTIFTFLISLIIATNISAQVHRCAESKSLHNLKNFFKYNKTAYPGDNSFDALYYKLILNIDYDSRMLKGEVTVSGKSMNDNLSNVFLDLQNTFTVDSVIYNDSKIGFNHQSDKLNLTFPHQLNFNDEFSVTVFYRGIPGSSGFGSFEFNSTPNGHPAIWTLSEPYGASDWWPCKDTPADKVDSSDVIVTSDEGFVSVSNGKLISVTDNGNGTKTYEWKNSYPIAHYLISLAMANYETFEEVWNYDSVEMDVIHYNYPENLNSARISQLKKTIPMLDLFSDLFGLYPFSEEKYGHAEFGWGGGMEHQTVSSMGSFGEGIVAHELAHQWFGDKITCADWHSIWLNEGFATYSEALWTEHAYGKSSYDNQILSEMGSPTQWWTAKAATGTLYVQDISSVNSIFNSARSYAKGAIVLHMLRGVLGDEIFFETLNKYANHPVHSHSSVVTEDFQQVAEEVSGKDLDYFFDEWIYGVKYPKYSYSFYVNQSTSNLEVKISQSNNSNPQFFTMPIQLRLVNSEIDTIVTVFNDQQTQTFEFPGITSINNVIFDPNNWIMKDVNLVTSIDDNFALNSFELFQNYPNPFNPTTIIEYTVPSNEYVSLNVYDILGNEIAVLVNEQKSQGNYQIEFNAENLPSGTYFYKLTSGSYTEIKKMMLIK
ncbi:MAG: T9SS type A sorting domain-containing protein [Melioribacteraceae bacterium]|nr:T9SS type A sorting domain-containing protein [Melioribacteraceae bacterium]